MSDKKFLPFKFSQTDVEITAKFDLYSGFFRFVEYRFRHKLFNGGWSKEIRREVLERGNAGVILPYDPCLDKLVLVEQIRLPAIETSKTPWLLEAIAGMVEQNENLEQLVRREAKEEAGITILHCYYALSYLTSPGNTTERIYVHIGEFDASAIKLGIVHGLSIENEDIRVHVVSREQAYQWVESGVIDNAATVIAIQWLQLNHLKLKNNWLNKVK